MSAPDRLAEIKARWADIYDHESLSGLDIDWLIAEVERLREVRDGKRTPESLLWRMEVLRMAGAPPTAEIIAYADQLLDEMERQKLNS